MSKYATIFAALACALTVTASAETLSVELATPGMPARLSVDLEWGSIRVTGSSNATDLTILAIPDQPGEVGGSLIEVSEHDNVVSIRQAPLESGSFRSANLEITVPRTSDLELIMNRGGDIWVHDVDGLVEVTNLNGSVELSGLSKAAAVNASNGSISASFTDTDSAQDMIFTSLNGSIELCLPSEYSGRVDLATAGDRVQSDFPIETDDSIRTVAAGESVTLDQIQVSGTIGSGGAVLQASTLNGEISLRLCDESR
jgi:hypothetical protein